MNTIMVNQHKSWISFYAGYTTIKNASNQERVSVRDSINSIVLWFLIIIFNRILASSLTKNITLNKQNYPVYKSAQLSMRKNSDFFEKVRDWEIDPKATFMVRHLIRSIQKGAAIQLNFLSKLDQAFDDLRPKNAKIFTHVDGDQMWADRPSAYTYQI